MDSSLALVRETGLEPAWAYTHKYLKLARLPIPPFPQRKTNHTIALWKKQAGMSEFVVGIPEFI